MLILHVPTILTLCQSPKPKFRFQCFDQSVSCHSQFNSAKKKSSLRMPGFSAQVDYIFLMTFSESYYIFVIISYLDVKKTSKRRSIFFGTKGLVLDVHKTSILSLVSAR